MATAKKKASKKPTFGSWAEPKRTKRGKAQDAKLKPAAKKPGKRVSASGNVYTEVRTNRSDVSKRARV
jgi:hypothetical protein